MTPRSILSPHCVDARYAPSRLPHFAGNPLIEALPPALEPDEVLSTFSATPPFDEAQRAWTISERIQMLKTLSTFMVPLERHLALAAELDSLVRNGLVSKRPGTPEFVQKLQRVYESSMTASGRACIDAGDDELQQALLLMGVSGMGKTRFLKRWAASMPKVIYHPTLNLYQIPVLHLEMPSNGMSVAGLCNGILRAVDKLVPGCNYLENLALKGKPSVETLLQRVAGVLYRHCVGLLIGDEIQNLTNAGKAKQTVMTELVSMSNLLSVPIVFIGTNKAASLFGLDFRQTRRVCGLGGDHWDRLHEGHFCTDDEGEKGEWQGLLEVLWRFQWTRNPVPLTAELSSTLYWCSQGVIDSAIKVFAAAQARAMLDGTEVLTSELLLDVYQREFALMHPMMEALRSGDEKALAAFDDIRPLQMTDLLDKMKRRGVAATSAAFKVTPDLPSFAPQVAMALIAMGLPEEESEATAQEVCAEGKARTLVQATEQALAKLKPRARVAPSKSKSTKRATPEPADYVDRPNDYRYAMQLAKSAGTSVLERLRELGAVRPVGELFALA